MNKADSDEDESDVEEMNEADSDEDESDVEHARRRRRSGSGDEDMGEDVLSHHLPRSAPKPSSRPGLLIAGHPPRLLFLRMSVLPASDLFDSIPPPPDRTAMVQLMLATRNISACYRPRLRVRANQRSTGITSPRKRKSTGGFSKRKVLGHRSPASYVQV